MILLFTYCVLGFAGLCYLYLRSKWNKWQRIGVKVVQPKFPLGSFPFLITGSESPRDAFARMAKETNWHPVVGAYILHNPVLIIQDPDLAKTIFVKDFKTFHDRHNPNIMKRWTPLMHQADKIVMHDMFSGTGENWKSQRSTLTPVFTSGKIKAMMIFINETGNRLMNALDKFANDGTNFEAKLLLGKFSMDTIASCAFGVDAKVYGSESSAFLQHSTALFKQPVSHILKMKLALTSFGPKLMKALDWSVYPKHSTLFLAEVIKQTLRKRQESKMRRNDAIDLMMDAIKGDLDQEQEELDQHNKDAQIDHKSSQRVDEDAIIRAAFSIMLAGFDTTGATLAFMCYQLAKNPDVQEKLREEIDAIFEDDKINIKYEDLQSMPYMEQVISEVLRVLTPNPMFYRVALQDYKFCSDFDISLSKNSEVWVNVAGIHADPKHYKNPDRFDPEHFTPEAKAARHPYAYLPFGHGPRNCIGMRFALLEIKVAVIKILKRYAILPSEKTKEPICFDASSVVTYAKDGLFLTLERRT